MSNLSFNHQLSLQGMPIYCNGHRAYPKWNPGTQRWESGGGSWDIDGINKSNYAGDLTNLPQDATDQMDARNKMIDLIKFMRKDELANLMLNNKVTLATGMIVDEETIYRHYITQKQKQKQ